MRSSFFPFIHLTKYKDKGIYCFVTSCEPGKPGAPTENKGFLRYHNPTDDLDPPDCNPADPDCMLSMPGLPGWHPDPTPIRPARSPSTRRLLITEVAGNTRECWKRIRARVR